MNIKSYPLKRGQWFEEATEKKYVVWHGTAGRTLHTPSSGRPGRANTSSTAGTSTPSASARRIWWTATARSTRLSTTRGGSITSGSRARMGATTRRPWRSSSRTSSVWRWMAIGCTRSGSNTPNTVYTGPFFAYDWRDYSYFAQLDEAQVDAGIELTLDICRRHDIEPSFYYPSTTFDFPRCFQVATIVCHSNCRRDKTDLALPDWVYERVEGAGIRLVS